MADDFGPFSDIPSSVKSDPFADIPAAPKTPPKESYIGKGIESLARTFTQGPGMYFEEVEKQPLFQKGQENIQQGTAAVKKGDLSGLAQVFLGGLQKPAGYVTGAASLAGQVDPGAVPEAAGEANLARQTAKEMPKAPGPFKDLPEAPNYVRPTYEAGSKPAELNRPSGDQRSRWMRATAPEGLFEGQAPVLRKGSAIAEGEAKSLSAAASTKTPLPETPTKEFTDSLSDQLYQMRQANQADKLEFQKTVKELSPEMKQAEREGVVYRSMEGEALPDALKEEYQQKIQPYKDEETSLFKDIRGFNELDDETIKELEESLQPNYVHRVSADHPNVYDPYLAKDEGQPYTGQGSRLPQTTASLKQTKYDVIENAKGERKVVIKNNDGTLSIVNKGQNPVSIKPSLGATETELTYNKPFTANGQQWTLKRAKTEEIEGATGAKYQKYGILNTLQNVEKLRNLKRSLSILKALRASDEWAKYTGDKPGYRTPNIDIPALQGKKMDPRLAEVFEDVWKNRDPDRLGDAIDTINNAYMNVLFLNPIPHGVNVTAWNVLANTPDALRLKPLQETYAQAIKEVKNTGPIYRELLRNGMAGQYARQVNHDYWKKMLKGIGEAVVEDPKQWQGFAKNLGFNKVSDFFKKWSEVSNNELWRVNDIMLTQRVLLTMKTRGWSMQRAIKDAETVIPNYRVPTRLADSRLLNRAFTTNRAFAFGRYHFNSLSNLGSIVGKATKGDREAGVRLATILLGGALWNVALDRMSDNNEVKKWVGFGPWTIPQRLWQNTKDVAQNKESLGVGAGRVIGGTIMPSPLVDMVMNAIQGRDYFGREITQKEASVPEQAGEYAAFFASMFPYVREAQQARDTVKQGQPVKAATDFAGEQVGIRSQKPYNEKGKTAAKNLQYRKKHPRNIIEEFLP